MPDFNWRYSLGVDGTDVDGGDDGGDDGPRTCGFGFHFEVELSERFVAFFASAWTVIVVLLVLRWLRG